MIEVTILGTSSMVPTKDRNVSGIYAEINGKGILFDCGEGSQRQMNIAGINRNKVQYIFISHWHADHVAGLMGLMQTIQNNGVEAIKLFGPVGSKVYFDHLIKASFNDHRIEVDVREFDCETVTEIFKCDEFVAQAVNVKHGTPCLSFSITESDKRKIKLDEVRAKGIPEGPILAQLQNGTDVEFNGEILKSSDFSYVIEGKKVSYVVDTAFVNTAIDIARDSDLLLSEATFADEHIEKAEEYDHMTATQAGQIASMSNSSRLVVCHISQRYKDPSVLLDEAKSVFPNSEIGYDLMKIVLK